MGPALLLLLALGGATGPRFDATFTPPAVAAYLSGKAAYVVVGAGPGGATLADAVAAFEGALRRSGRAELVMNGKTMGGLGELDDPAVVKRCAQLPVARVAVVRVFEAAGEPPRAVVMVYGKDAALLGAFTGQAGVPLAPPAGPPAAPPASAGQGVSSAVAVAVLEATKEAGTPAQEEYDREYVWFADLAAVNGAGNVLSTWSVPYQGKYRKPLEGAAFYETVDRPDLAARYRVRRNVRYALGGAGFLVMVGVPAVAVVNMLANECEPGSANFSSCQDGKTKMALIGIPIGLGVGGALMIAAAFVNPHPVDPPEARELADEHNKRLKAKLGLAAAEPAPEREEERGEPRVSLSLAPARGGGMVGLALRF